MKLKNYFLSMLAAGALISCSADEEGPDIKPQVEPDAFIAIAAQSDVITRAGIFSPEDVADNVIKDLTVAVFDNGAYEESSGYTANMNPLRSIKTVTLADLEDGVTTVNEVTEIPVKSGALRIMVLANVNTKLDWTSLTQKDGNGKYTATLQQFLNATTDLSKEAADYLTMSSAVISVSALPGKTNCLGYNNQELLEKGSTHNLTPFINQNEVAKDSSSDPVLGIKLYRTVSRVQLNQITYNWDETWGTNPSWDIKSVFVANAKQFSKMVSVGGWGIVESSVSQWYDGALFNGVLDDGFYTGDLKHHVTETAQSFLNETATPSTVPYFFYVYENGIDKDLITPTSDFTLLVIEADLTYTLHGATAPKTDRTYYSVVVNKGVNTYSGIDEHEYIMRNVKYVINVTITGPGSETPYNVDKTACIAAKVAVVNWAVVNIDDILD